MAKQTSAAAIAELIEIASIMDLGCSFSGVSRSLRGRCNHFLLENGIPFYPWVRYPRFWTQPAIVGELVIPVHNFVTHDVIDDLAHVISGKIAKHLLGANWEQLKNCALFNFKKWDTTKADAAFRKAAKEIPILCAQLQDLPNNDGYEETRTYDGVGARRAKGV